jgi:hypothetical protein
MMKEKFRCGSREGMDKSRRETREKDMKTRRK